MLALDNLLLEKRVPASFVAGVMRLAQCSLLDARLLAKDVLLLGDLLQNHAKIYATAEIQQFLKSSV